MNISKITFLVFFLFSVVVTNAQDNLFKELDTDSIAKKEIATAGFK